MALGGMYLEWPYCLEWQLDHIIWLVFNTLRPRQNGRHLADNIFKCIFLNENVWTLIEISLNFVLKGSINNILSLVQIMVWCRPGDKPLSEEMMVRLTTHICVTRPQWVNMCRLCLVGLTESFYTKHIYSYILFVHNIHSQLSCHFIQKYLYNVIWTYSILWGHILYFALLDNCEYDWFDLFDHELLSFKIGGRFSISSRQHREIIHHLFHLMPSVLQGLLQNRYDMGFTIATWNWPR